MGRLEDLGDEIHRRADVLCAAMGLECVDVTVRLYNDTWHVQVLADLPLGGIGIEACTELNRRLDKELYEDMGLGNDYTLEVSSPGLDRPLTAFADFRRSVGRDVQVFLKMPLDGKKEYSGQVIGVRDGEVIMLTNKGEVLIRIDHIEKGKQIIA